MNWYVLYTKPRWEKKIADLLAKRGIEVFCPMTTEIRQWSDRKKKVVTPLFKSYVFVKLAEKDRSIVFEVPGVVQYLFWLGKPAVVRNQEIQAIENWLNDEQIDFINVEHLNPGDHLTIAKGQLKGREAEISEVGRSRLRLILRDMGLVVNVKISEAYEKGNLQQR